MNTLKFFIAIVSIAFLASSCIEKAKPNQDAGMGRNMPQNQSKPAGAQNNVSGNNSASKNAGYVINTKANYFKEMRNALGINNKQMKRLMSIAEKYQPRIKANKNNPQKLANVREAKNNEFAQVLSDQQMEQKKYFDAVMYGYAGDSAAHPVNLKRAIGATDAQMLEYAAIQGAYGSSRKGLKAKGQLTDAKLGELLGERNEKLSKIFSEAQFSKFRQILKQTYGNK